MVMKESLVQQISRYPYKGTNQNDRDRYFDGGAASAVFKAQHQNKGPYQVELLLNGQGPEVLEDPCLIGIVAVKKQCAEYIAARDRKFSDQYQDSNESDIGIGRRKNSEAPPQIEAFQADRPVFSVLAKKKRCNQEPADYKKYVDPSRPVAEQVPVSRYLKALQRVQ